MSESNRRDQGRKHWCYGCTRGPCQAMNVVISKPPGNSKHGSWANTPRVPHPAFSTDTVKSKLVPNSGTSGAYCYTEENWARGKPIRHIVCSFYFSAVFLDFRAREVPLSLCSVRTFLHAGKPKMPSSASVTLT